MTYCTDIQKPASPRRRSLKRTLMTALTAVGALTATTSLAADMFLDDAILVNDDGSTQTVDIQIRDGMIAAMADGLQSTGEGETISGAWVTAGLVAPYSSLGLVDISGEGTTNDIRATTELFSASLNAADSYNPRNVHIPNARRRGVLYAAVVPQPSGERIFAGSGLTAVLDGSDNSILTEGAFMHIALGEAGANRAGGSRAAAMQQLRSAIADARRSYLQHIEGDVFQRRDARAFRAVASGRMPLMISASRASDLRRIIQLSADFENLEIMIVGAEEAYLVADELATSGIKVIVDPLENLPDTFDSVNASLDNIIRLDAAGVDYAIAPLSALGTVKAGILAQHAGNAVGNGLSREAAMRAITTTPAEWFGIDLGLREAGQPASLVVWDGDPLEVTSAPIAMYRDGEALSLESRMTALRDRYNPIVRDTRPHKYR